MPSPLPFRAFVGVALALSCSIALADEKTRSEASNRTLAIQRPKAGVSPAESTGGWWLGSVGVAGALAVFGGVSLASKRFLPNRDGTSIQVVGRSNLSTKHAVSLVRVGNRVLIVGTGPQGPPSTLGEITDPVELAKLIPRRSTDGPTASTVRPAPMMAKTTGFDRRIGDDE